MIVIGGGDTGSDCVGTSNRQEAESVTNFEIMPKPSSNRSEDNPWPYWPFKLKTSSSHEEGIHREWSILSKEFIGDGKGNVKALKTVEVEWVKKEGEKPQLKEVNGSEKLWPCDLDQLSIKTDDRNQLLCNNYQTNILNIFSAGDMRRGQSLIVWAISEGREAAAQVDKFLMGYSNLETKEKGDLPSVN